MKKCPDCGCHNQNARVTCADCGRTLAGAEEVSEAELDAKLEKMNRYSDPFSFKPRYQAVFYASLPALAACIVLIYLSLIEPAMALIAILCFIICIIFARFSQTMWNIQKFFLQFKVSGGLEPSDWWFISREIMVFGFFITGVAMFVYGVLNNAAV